MGLGSVLARTPSQMTWIRCPSSRSVTRRRASSAPALTLCPARSATPLPSTARSTSMTVPPGSVPALAGAGAAGGGPAGLAPRIFSVARSSASRLEGTVLTSWPPMSTCTVTHRPTRGRAARPAARPS
jgi:hypothetical protein